MIREIAVNSSVIDYYCQLIRNSLKNGSNESEREQKEIQVEIEKLSQRLQNARSLVLDGDFTADEFKEIKKDLQEKIEGLEKKKARLVTVKNDYQEYLAHGGEIMKNIATRYIAASPIGKKQIIGSIFAEKLIFSENKYRTTEPNVILELISRPRAGSEEDKKRKAGDFSDLSTSVPRTGFVVLCISMI